MCCRATPLQQTRCTANQGAGAYGEYAARSGGLAANPGKDLLILHQCFLPKSPRHMQDIERRCIAPAWHPASAAIPSCRERSSPSWRRCDRSSLEFGIAPRRVRSNRFDRAPRTTANRFASEHPEVIIRISPTVREWTAARLSRHAFPMAPKPARSPPNATRMIEILAFPAVQLLDVTGPLQVFASANDLMATTGEAPPLHDPAHRARR